MNIQIEWDRTRGLKAQGRVVGVILDNMEKEPALFEVKKAIVEALDAFDGWGEVSIIRLDDPMEKEKDAP